MRKPKQPGSAPHTHGWALGVQGQLMLFLCGITVLTLGLVWGLITYGLQPMYNRNIQKRLERESSVIAGMIDSAGGQISSRDYGSLTLQNETFWSNLKTALENGVINALISAITPAAACSFWRGFTPAFYTTAWPLSVIT